MFLGIEGGQSHTEAVIADEKGNVLGIGLGGALDHGNFPEGRERLKKAVNESISEALKNANLPEVEGINFASVHCGLTCGADFKEEIAGFAKKIVEETGNGNEVLENLIEHGAKCLVENVKGAAKQLGF